MDNIILKKLSICSIFCVCSLMSGVFEAVEADTAAGTANNVPPRQYVPGPTLQSLDISANGRLTNVGIQALQDRMHLRILELHNKGLNSLVGFPDMRNARVRTLDLEDNPFTDWDSVWNVLQNNLPNLKRLSLSGTNLTSNALQNFPNVHLEHLYIFDNPGLQQQDIQNLKNRLPNCRIYSDFGTF